jgi:hypothetical protein
VPRVNAAQQFSVRLLLLLLLQHIQVLPPSLLLLLLPLLPLLLLLLCRHFQQRCRQASDQLVTPINLSVTRM